MVFLSIFAMIYNTLTKFMPMKKILLLLIFATVFPSVSVYAAGKVYYASPVGTGDGSSYEKPCSFTSGINKISSGDTLYLLGGQYDLSARVNVGKGKSGTSSKRTVIAGYSGEKAILDYRKQPYGSEVSGTNNIGLCLSEGGVYFHLKDLRFVTLERTVYSIMPVIVLSRISKYMVAAIPVYNIRRVVEIR